MTLSIELTPLMQARLEEEAARRGLAVERIAIAMIEEKLGGTFDESGTLNSQQERSEVKERVRLFDEMIESFSDIQAPEIPSEPLRRENLYDD